MFSFFSDFQEIWIEKCHSRLRWPLKSRGSFVDFLRRKLRICYTKSNLETTVPWRGWPYAKCIALVKKERSERWKAMELEYKLKRKEKRVTCDICYYIFSNQSARDRHREAQHTQNKNTTSSKKDSVTKTSLELKCEECGKVFKHHTSLKRHLVEHESTENYSCKRCDAKFIRKDTLDYGNYTYFYRLFSQF